MKSLLLTWIALLGTLDLFAQSGACFICGGRFTGDTIYARVDGVTGKQEFVCESCAILPALCFACGLPVRTGATALPDGRAWCDRDAKSALLLSSQVQEVCSEATEQITRCFSRFISFPFERSRIHVIDRVKIETLFKSPGADRDCPMVYGFVQTERKTNAPFQHHIHVLIGLDRARTKSSLAHEMTHSWMSEHVPTARRLGADAAEGFCELVAYRLMEHLGETREMGAIKANTYTRGQFDLMLLAEQKHGFYEVSEWVKAGEDPLLLAEDIDRVRLTRPLPVPAPRSPAPLTAPAVAIAPRPSAAPDTLLLKGIVGSGDSRRALVNDRILAAGEEAKVRVGSAQVTVKCLEIRADAVIVQISGTPERQELRLPPPPALAPAPFRPNPR